MSVEATFGSGPVVNIGAGVLAGSSAIPPLRGPDVSVYQGHSVDWGAVRSDGASFAFCKASEGVGWTDATYQRNWAAIRDVGLVRGCYHFSRPEWNDPAHEAAWFLSLVPHLETYDLVALDIETGPTGPGALELGPWALEWLEHVGGALRTTPLLYTFQFFAEQRLRTPALSRYPLWLAAYDGECPPQVGVWNEVALWQRTNRARYKGIDGLVDESVLVRDLAGLRRLGKPPGPRKIVVTRDMMLRTAPGASHVYKPVQMVYRGATLDVIAPEEEGWLEVRAGTRSGWLLKRNTQAL